MLKQSGKIPENIRWKNWRDLRIGFFDIEGTNLGFVPYDECENYDYWISVNGHMKIVEFGIQIKVNNVKVDEFYVHVNPQIPIPEKATEIHGITNELVADCPTFGQMWLQGDMERVLKSCDVLCAYNGLGYDKDQLELELSRVAGSYVQLAHYMIDPFVLFKEIRKKKVNIKGKNNLLSAASHFGCGQVSQIKYKEGLAHRTEPDINMLSDLLYKMAEKDMVIVSMDELAEFQDKAWNSQEEYNAKKKIKKEKEKAEKELLTLDLAIGVEVTTDGLNDEDIPF
jgi:DNA polymerase III epsilon subunit-like protein